MLGDALQFLSKGIQFGLLVLFVIIVVLCMKVASFEHRLEILESNIGQFVTKDDLYEGMRAESFSEDPPIVPNQADSQD